MKLWRDIIKPVMVKRRSVPETDQKTLLYRDKLL